MEDVVLSLVQMQSELGDLESNLDRMLEYVRSSSSDIICFPEMCITGYDSKMSHLYAMDISNPIICELRKAATRYDRDIVFGFPEESCDEAYITQAIAGCDGTIAIYRKTHLGLLEKRSFSPGDEFIVKETRKANVGLELCWEGHIPEISTCLRVKGADMILIPHASFMGPKDRIEKWMRFLPARAYDNRVFVAACNAISGTVGGGTLILDPRGEVMALNDTNEESMTTVSLRKEMLSRVQREGRRSMKDMDFFEARRPELYQDITRN